VVIGGESLEVAVRLVQPSRDTRRAGAGSRYAQLRAARCARASRPSLRRPGIVGLDRRWLRVVIALLGCAPAPSDPRATSTGIVADASTTDGPAQSGSSSSSGDDSDAGGLDPASSSSSGEPPPAEPALVRVVQCNPYYAGRLDPYDQGKTCAASSECSDPCPDSDARDCGECIDHRCHVRDWSTARNLAARIRDIEAEVIGIEEMTPASAEIVVGIIGEATGVSWEHRTVDQGIDGVGSGVGVMWRSDRIALVEDLGYLDADLLDSGYALRFAGVLLETVEGGRSFGMFAGKLDWHADNAEGRRAQAERVRDWVDERMATHPEALARIIATDANDVPGSPAHDVLAAEYDPGDAVKHTIPGAGPDTTAGRRIDFLFWSVGAPGPEQGGFVGEQSDGRLGRSGFFGSDHRFVYGDALVP
jgi:hypothetical protein